VPGDRLVIRRNPDYAWGPPFYKPAVSNSVDEIEFRFYEDEATRSLALESGEAQVMGELPPLDARALTGNNTVQVLPVPVAGQPLQFLLNTQQYPTDNLQIRQALLYGANRNAIVDTVFQRFSPIAWGPLTANTLYYSKAVVGTYAHDTAQAQTLLQQAGYADNNGDGILDFNGVDLAIKVIVPPWGLLPQVAQLLQDQWKTLGVRVNLVSVPTVGALNDAVKAGDYNLVAFNSYGVDPAFLSQYYVTGAPNNYSKYSDPQLDDLLNKAGQATDPVARGDLYAQAQAIIMNQALVLPIRDQVNLNGASANIGELAFDPFGWFPLLNNAIINNG
jgi:peptide/nickel transport system substrate-binding protein